MRRAVLILLIAAGAGALLAGCSGAGAPVQELRGGATQALAQDTLTAMALVSDWVKIIYTARPAGTYRREEVTVDGARFLVTYSTYGSVAESVQRVNLEDNSWTEVITYHGEPEQVLSGSAGPLVENGNGNTQSGEWQYPGGQRRTWLKRNDFGTGQGAVTTVTGDAFTKSGTSMSYRWERRPKTEDSLSVTLPDRTTFAWHVRLTGSNRPRREQGVRGRLTPAVGNGLTFRLSGVAEKWDLFAVTAGQDLSGNFTIVDDMAGSGSFEIGQETVGQLRWDHEMQGTLDLFEGTQETVWPTASALNFQMRNWIDDVAGLGPFPF
jgi:hypothetical protein